ncbi:MAG: 50S ribosomal protein L10 [Nitrosopumilus sp.]|nr:50S ribosomal protein L10 [Nitrosopumilus sp.]MDA7943455.1 50S ribosomal protein L10 [Nitrosopumilus sp.]MDA7958701.1 50S ribosomal protein L10 [Nitrosopumilus sp.]MDA7959998.1 50S ribosomal protein L10 [Nitrosopumilus sp.]MDA7999198.1 50S ribosomal protein L10 [Nitrosopumilus sp.]
MQSNRTKFPERKARMYAQLQELPAKHRVVALVRMEKVRSAQVLPLRRLLKGKALLVSIKDRVAKKALAGSEIASRLQGQCMLVFTDISPFRLNVLLAKNRVMMAARGGDVASMDVVVTARNTGIAPGPMLTEFKDAGIPTKIDQGTIWIAKDTTPVKKGEVINEKLASMLSKLDIKPVEAGIALDAAIEDGRMYTREELVVDVEAALEGISAAHAEAVSLSVEAAYPVEESIRMLLGIAAGRARSLAAESGYVSPDTIEDVLQRAGSRASALAGAAKGYEPS